MTGFVVQGHISEQNKNSTPILFYFFNFFEQSITCPTEY